MDIKYNKLKMAWIKLKKILSKPFLNISYIITPYLKHLFYGNLPVNSTVFEYTGLL